ncbi:MULTISPECIES: helix-turn-helix transcriptional regulator [Streptomyces]|uniref:YafY family transcriptional regulator n=1 Tax=Streptomyces tsukubensis (strain DSM 42081 / NBRC 108919 / NRRL 18488 / 9993) TaxID=1114943 RepID=I2MVY3_STRT9|nr:MULTISPECIES: YafY family protein [Streptomyces]AZK93381.1 DNA-binding transcriptional regulator [Streptomyces tsukubensis]EIF88930.1 transcriptional repressor [Streptomyces tsukubensis NRRL18488]MYS64266.1 WYL domain-containing protein [Streptomyces sp. SID5473]QKM70463.1 YafY family transcriptional regulator [Streptomyces tsukubensis NRRL18488]TAI40478.1 YafY family transcriptional regulator [Streptomyces tsukubensis]
MLETSARLLRLLSLLQAHREWSGADLARRLGVTPRTVRRDVDRLRELGYPVNASPGTGGGYRLGAGARLPPLLLDDDEAVAVAVGLRTAAGQGIEGIGESSVRALAKLEQVLPDRLRRRVGALNAFTVPLLRTSGAGLDASVLTELAHACRDSETLRFRYEDHGGTATRRTVEPHRLVCTERRWYLVAWDVDRADWRTFRADRIVPTPPHGPRFTPRTPPAEDLAAYVSRGLSTRAYATEAVIRLHMSAERARERISPSDGVVEPVDDGHCLLHTGATSLDVMVIHVMLMGVDFEVVEPVELVEHIRMLRDRLGRAVGRVRPVPDGVREM